MGNILGGKEEFESVGDGLLVRAPAKINLSLLIAGKRDDGYHEIDTVMSKVDFYDELFFTKGVPGGIELVCQGPCWAPEGSENLVYRACEMLLGYSGVESGIKVVLEKNIPAGTGLGGASSDAAAALKGVNELLDLGICEKKLFEFSCQLGSDVPFFLGGPLSHCTGKGGKIEPVGANFEFSALLIFPDVSVSTQEVYENYTHYPEIFSNLGSKINSYIEKKRIDLVVQVCANMLQNSCFGLYNRLGELKGEIESLGLRPLCLSGSGSAFYYVIKNDESALVSEYRSILKDRVGCESVLVHNNRW